MTEAFEPGAGEDGQPLATIVGAPPESSVGEHEQLPALPALVDHAGILADAAAPAGLPERSPGLMLPAVQAAAVAAGGFVAGAAVVGLVHRRQRRSAALGRGRRSGRGVGSGGARSSVKGSELLQIVGSRSLLVDVHLLGGRGER